MCVKSVCILKVVNPCSPPTAFLYTKVFGPLFLIRQLNVGVTGAIVLHDRVSKVPTILPPDHR